MQSLLNLRKQKERSALQEVSSAQDKLNYLFSILQDLKKESNSLEAELKEKQKSTVPIHEFRNHSLYIQSMKQKMIEQQDLVMQAQNLLELKRKDVEEAMKDKKIIEKLKLKQYDAWQENFTKIESKLLDELATIRHIREKK